MFRALLLAIALLPACRVKQVTSSKDMSAYDQKAFDKAEAYYLDQARQTAAFLSGCLVDEIEAEVLLRKRVLTEVYNGERYVTVDAYQRPTLLGTRGCDTRMAFVLACQESTSFGAPTAPVNARIDGRFPEGCDVLPSSRATAEISEPAPAPAAP